MFIGFLLSAKVVFILLNIVGYEEFHYIKYNYLELFTNQKTTVYLVAL